MRPSPPWFGLCVAWLAWVTVGCSSLRTGPYQSDAAGSCGTSLGACNVVTQSGCTNNQSCVLITDADGGVSASCAAGGTGAYGTACSATSGCALGLQCVAGQCRRACCVGDDSTCAGGGAPAGSACTAGIQGAPSGLAVCTFACDWTTQNCPSNQTCLPISADGTADCTAAGSSTEGTTCTDSSECRPGLACLGTSSSTTGTCARICDPTAGGPNCTSTQTCTHVSTYPATFGYCA